MQWILRKTILNLSYISVRLIDRYCANKSIKIVIKLFEFYLSSIQLFTYAKLSRIFDKLFSLFYITDKSACLSMKSNLKITRYRFEISLCLRLENTTLDFFKFHLIFSSIYFPFSVYYSSTTSSSFQRCFSQGDVDSLLHFLRVISSLYQANVQLQLPDWRPELPVAAYGYFTNSISNDDTLH